LHDTALTSAEEAETSYCDLWYFNDWAKNCLTTVHISANASASDDLRNNKRVQNILNWDSGRRIAIYPPPEFPHSSTLYSHSCTDPAAPGRHTFPQVAKEITPIEPPDSPSQIPDSNPPTPNRNAIQHSILDIIDPDPPSYFPSQPELLPSANQESPDHAMQIAYQPSVHPPRAASLQPIHLSPPQSSLTESSISPDRRPDKFPIFTSTPKSRPLKQLLTNPAVLPFSQ